MTTHGGVESGFPACRRPLATAGVPEARARLLEVEERARDRYVPSSRGFSAPPPPSIKKRAAAQGPCPSNPFVPASGWRACAPGTCAQAGAAGWRGRLGPGARGGGRCLHMRAGDAHGGIRAAVREGGGAAAALAATGACQGTPPGATFNGGAMAPAGDVPAADGGSDGGMAARGKPSAHSCRSAPTCQRVLYILVKRNLAA